MTGPLPSTLRKKIEWLVRRAEGALLPDSVLADHGAHLDPDGARLALRMAPDDVDIVAATPRVAALFDAIDDRSARASYIAAHGIHGVHRFAAQTATVWRLPVEAFPRHVANVYLVEEGGESLLFDCGSGCSSSERDLALGFAILEHVHAAPVRREAITTCLVSHEHGDHFGGASALRERSRAHLAAHEVAAQVIESAAEPTRVDRIVRDGEMIGPGWMVRHAPGHSAGLACLRVHDVLLTSDLVLAGRVPHVLDGRKGGLDRYLASIGELRRMGARLALGGHDGPIADVAGRIDAIAAAIGHRLERVLEACETPRTSEEIAAELFGELPSHGTKTALRVVAAYLDHLAARGRSSATTAPDGVSRYRTTAGR